MFEYKTHVINLCLRTRARQNLNLANDNFFFAFKIRLCYLLNFLSVDFLMFDNKIKPALKQNNASCFVVFLFLMNNNVMRLKINTKIL